MAGSGPSSSLPPTSVASISTSPVRFRFLDLCEASRPGAMMRSVGQRTAHLVGAVGALDGSWAAPFFGYRKACPHEGSEIQGAPTVRRRAAVVDDRRRVARRGRAGERIPVLARIVRHILQSRGELPDGGPRLPFRTAHTSRDERWHDVMRTHGYRLAATLQDRRKPPNRAGR